MTRAAGVPGLDRGELARKLIHVAAGAGAFGVVLLGPIYSAWLAFGLLLFNLFVLSRSGGRRLWREEDRRRGYAAGILLYPLMLLLLLLVFRRRLEIPAATWSILAFGDGMATILGRAWGRRSLPWNPAKSVAGTLACWLCGASASTAVLAWTLSRQDREVDLAFIAMTAVLTALLAAWVESLPQRFDDNLSVPLWSAAFLWIALSAADDWSNAEMGQRLATCAFFLVLVFCLALLAYLVRARNRE